MNNHSELLKDKKLELLKLDEIIDLINELELIFSRINNISKQDKSLFANYSQFEEKNKALNETKVRFEKFNWSDFSNSNNLTSFRNSIFITLLSIKRFIFESPQYFSIYLYSLYSVPAEFQSDFQSIIDQKENLIKTSEEIKSLLDRAKQYLEDSLNINYQQQFSKSSKKFKRSANWFLGLTISSLFILILFILYFIPNLFFVNEISNQFPLNNVIIKLGLISTIAWLVLFFHKNYNNNKHLSYIYEQKFIMLSTYMDFINTIKDEEIKNQVAAEIGKIIFEVADTGYIKSPPEINPTLFGQLFNVLKQNK